MGTMLRELCLVSIICSVVCGLSPDGAVKRILGICCSVILMLIVLEPMGDFDMGNYAGFLTKYRELENRMLENAENVNSRLNRLVIEDEYETYIMDKAREEGIEISQVKLELDWTAEGFWVPDAAYLVSGAPAEKLSDFSVVLVTEFGISEDKIVWERPA